MTYYDFWAESDVVYFVSDDLDATYVVANDPFAISFFGDPLHDLLNIIDDPIDAEELKALVNKISNKVGGVSGIANRLVRGWTAKHPVTGEVGDLGNIVMNLNDNRKWTRGQIADWLDTLPAQPKLGGNNA